MNKNDQLGNLTATNGLAITGTNWEPLISTTAYNSLATGQVDLNVGISNEASDTRKIVELEKKISEYENIISKKELRFDFNREKIIKNVKDILTFLDKEIGEFGKLVCAGGAIRDLTLGKGIAPKDYDIYIICGDKINAEEKSKNSYKILEKLLKLTHEGAIRDDPDAFNNPKFYEPFPIKSFLYKDLKVQVMYKPEAIGENDLIDDFDWNFCSCFISKQKNEFIFGHGHSFPIGYCSGGPYIIKDDVDFIVDMKSTEPKEPSALYIHLNDSIKIRKPNSCFLRCFDLINKYKDLYSGFELAKESLKRISESFCQPEFSKKMKSGYIGLFYKK